MIEAVKSPKKVVKEKQESKKPTPPSLQLIKILDAKWSDRFLRLEPMLIARNFEKPAELTLQTVKVTPATATSRGS